MAQTAGNTARIPDTIYHIAPAESWPPANGSYAPDSLGAEGFIHASSWSQLQGVASNLFAGRTDLVVLEIDATRLPGMPVWEDLYDLGMDYPHVYSPIPVGAVTAILGVTWDETGAPWFHLMVTGADGGTGPEPEWRPVSSPSADDFAQLALMNSQLIEDEGHDIRTDRKGLEGRMRELLGSTYTAYLLVTGDMTAGYALVDAVASVPHVRQFFVRRGLRRQRIGSRAFRMLREELGSRPLTLDVLSTNARAMRFWHSLGFEDRSVTMVLNPDADTDERPDQHPAAASITLRRMSGDTRHAARYLKERIRAFNDEISPYHLQARRQGAVTEIAVMATDSRGGWHGGVCGSVYWNWLAVEDFWIEADLRGGGLGRRLLAGIEEMAVSRGATRAQLSTFSFQAREFYEKQGYSVVGELADFPPGESMFWMAKELRVPAAQPRQRPVTGDS